VRTEDLTVIETVGGRPHSAICRHDGEENSTQFSFIADPQRRQFHHCGQPCCNEWRTIDLG
jgi:hypothetical protein